MDESLRNRRVARAALLGMIGFVAMGVGFVMTTQEMTSIGPMVMWGGFLCGAVGVGTGIWFGVLRKSE